MDVSFTLSNEDDKLTQYSLSGRWSSINQSIAWIQTALTNNTAFNYIVSVSSTSALYSSLASDNSIPRVNYNNNEHLMIGSLGVMREGEIGYLVHPAAWGKGVAPEAVKALVVKYFEKYPDQEELTAHCDTENQRSVRVLEKLGFKEVDKQPIDMVELGMRMEIVLKLARTVALGVQE
jgi:RimJ/RimL family protein N-acetyltransferase